MSAPGKESLRYMSSSDSAPGVAEMPSVAAASIAAPIGAALRVITPETELPLVIRFAELFLGEATAEFFVQRTPETVAALVLSAFRHVQRSSPDRVSVTVVTPEQEPEPWSASVTVIRTHMVEAPFIVGSIREYLHTRQLTVERFLHPVLQ